MAKGRKPKSVKKEDVVGVKNENVVSGVNEKLKKENEELKKELSKLNNTIKDQLAQLLEENKQLKEKLAESESKDNYVGIRSVTKAKVWLPSPESKTDPTKKNYGKLLKPGMATVVPSYWVVDWITSGYLGLKMGDIIIDNEAGKRISPNVHFIDIKVPKDFYIFEYNAEEIKNMLFSDPAKLHSYINSNKNNTLVLNYIYSIVKSVIGDMKQDDEHYYDVESIIVKIENKLSGE